MFLLTPPIVKNSHILAGIYFAFQKKRPGPNLKNFRYRIWTSVNRSLKQLSSNIRFSTFSRLSWSNFKLKLNEKPHSYQNSPKNEVWRGLGRVRSKQNCFQRQSWTGYMRQTLVFVWNSAIRENFNFYFQQFPTGIGEFWVWGEGWALGYNSMKFWDFPDLS